MRKYFIQRFNLLKHFYSKHKSSIKQICKTIKFLFIIFLFFFGFTKNKTYYEDINLQFFSINQAQEIFENPIVDEVNLDNQPNRILLISSENVPITVTILKYKTSTKDKDIFIKTNISKILEPGDTLKISYLESEGIPNYSLSTSTEFGSAEIPLIYNGRYGNINKTKIKSTRKIIPYFYDWLVN